MDSNDLKIILEEHKKWLNNYGGNRANLRYANLRDADLRRANLCDADLRYANLRDADLRYADLRDADLRYANLRDADLRYADLRDANLRDADLCDADLCGANLCDANLRYADLRDANLCRANLCRANISGCKNNWTNPTDYIKQHFLCAPDGIITYKAFGVYKNPPSNWAILPGAIIEEEVNFNRADECGCGVNVATMEWIKSNIDSGVDVWRCLIRWEWLAGVCVPHFTDGKIRAAKVMLLNNIGTSREDK